MDLNMGTKIFLAKAEKIFLKPSQLYSYDEIINGCTVKDKFGDVHIMSAIDKSIWRGLHIRRDVQDTDGPKLIYTEFFNNNKKHIIETLKSINNNFELNYFSNQIYEELNNILKRNIKEEKLVYNRVRLPIDLVIEHIVAMAEELNSNRNKLVPLLFVPLDRESLRFAFDEPELKKSNFDDIHSIGDIESSGEYDRLQNIVQQRAEKIGKQLGGKYYRIYMELLWHKRDKNWGGNLFETNIDWYN